MYFMARAWGLKATDAIGLDRPYEGAERAQIVYVVAEKVMRAFEVIPKLPSKYMVDGDFDGFGNRYRTHASVLSYKHVSLSVLPLFFFFLLKRKKKNNYHNFRACRWVRPGRFGVIAVKLPKNGLNYLMLLGNWLENMSYVGMTRRLAAKLSHPASPRVAE